MAEAQMSHAQGHSYDDDTHGVGLHSVVEGEEEHHEKKSVLKKVKDKAKKIKDTLKKHSPGHNHDHDGDQGYNQDGEEDEEIEQDPEVHGAPMYESTVLRNVALDQKDISGQSKPNLGVSSSMEEDPHAMKSRPEAVSPGNYQTKVTDPTKEGGEEAGVGPILRSFEKMNVVDEPQRQQMPPSSHDQFSPESPRTFAETPSVESQSVAESEPPLGRQECQGQEDRKAHESSYNEKISSATSVIADKAMAAKNVVASKLGYGGGNNDAAVAHHPEGEEKNKSTPVAEYGNKIASTVKETLEPVYEKVSAAGTAVASKMPGTGTTTRSEDEGGHGTKGPDKEVSVKRYFAEKLRPTDEDRALSEVISEALQKNREEQQQREKTRDSSQPQGKVTESPEVASRLGTGEDAGEGLGSGKDSAGKGMVMKLKGAVGAWFGKGGESGETQASQESETQSPSRRKTT